MGLIPATGTAIQMGRVRNAYGLAGAARLRADLAPAVGKGASNNVKLSTDFGGQTTPNNY